MAVIAVDNIWKRYRIPHERRAPLLDNIAFFLSVLQGKRYDYEEFWALRGITFKIEHGESLGVIGPNGSGKSTLLKLIAGIIRPDRGRTETNGSVAPILELGIGFHGELTVTENALVYGVLMGLSRAEMKRRTESILDFADLLRFSDAKLKNLSSGMQVRLAFSIAIQANADIYLVDEALAVGDLAFQEKCLEKFREFKKESKSIVLVSSNMKLVESFCEKALYLLNGDARFFGSSSDATGKYLDDLSR